MRGLTRWLQNLQAAEPELQRRRQQACKQPQTLVTSLDGRFLFSS